MKTSSQTTFSKVFQNKDGRTKKQDISSRENLQQQITTMLYFAYKTVTTKLSEGN